MNEHQHHSSRPEESGDLRDRFEDVAPVILVDPEPVVRRGRRRRAAVRGAVGLGAVAAVLAVVLLVRPDGATTGPVATEPPPPEPARPVTIQVLPDVVEPGDVVTAVLVAHEENDLTFGVAAEVERWDGDEWRQTGVAALCVVEWECVGEVTDRLDAVNDIGLGASPGTPGSPTVLSTAGLGDGWYRLVQRAALGKGVATGLFEVRTGSGAAPPQPASDEVRLTVDPPLVPPDGGLVQVATQVPAGEDGTLTAEDIEEVDEALDRTALVQRWDGAEWLDVVDVPVLDREAGLGVEWGSPVALPALQEGSYRLVRTREGAPAPWGVFTVDAGAPALDQSETNGDSGLDADSEPEAGLSDERCAEDPGRCLLRAWWDEVATEAGIERGGGDHDVGLQLTDSVRMDGDRSLMLSLIPADATPPGVVPPLTVDTTTQVGDAQVEAGSWDDGSDGRRVTCGGFALHTRSTDLDADEIDHTVGLLAGALQDCPADVDALAARYPEIPPVP